MWGLVVSDYKREVLYLIGQNVRRNRQAEKMTQEALAEAANLSEKHLSAVENGRLENISIGYLIDIAEALSIDYKKLLEEKS
jgi:transcriptional regulator with XRE-family HTH domain